MLATAKRWYRDMSLLNLNYRSFYGPFIAAGLFLIPVSGHAQSGAFAGYDGNWSGNGSITIADQGAERIRCKGTYTVASGGGMLHQVLRCASDSYKFELNSDITASGNQLSGSWSEASRGVNGSVSGTISGGEIAALVQTNGYAATFSVVTKGNKQNVDISSKGEIRAVTIALTKGN
jgi:hypothetical protein